jgi:hypothetical protein
VNQGAEPSVETVVWRARGGGGDETDHLLHLFLCVLACFR